MRLKESVSTPSSSREATGSATLKLPAAMAPVACTRRKIGRESRAARPTAPPSPARTISSVIKSAWLRALASAAVIASSLKPR